MKTSKLFASLALAVFQLAPLTAGALAFEFDARRPISPADPLHFVGRLWLLEERAMCTAFLIGPDLIMTTASCLIDEKTHAQTKQKLRFDLFLQRAPTGNSSLLGSSEIAKVWMGTTDIMHSAENWAVLRLKTDLGTKHGWLEVGKYDGADLDPGFMTMVGYSQDFYDGNIPHLERDCEFHKYVKETGVLLHSCSTRAGGGSPLTINGDDGKKRLIALQVGENKDENLDGEPYGDDIANLAIPSERFYDFVMKIRKGQLK